MALTYFLKVTDSNREYLGRLNVIISQTVTYRATLLLPTHRKSRSGFQLVYLHLTLANSKGQDQGNANFD